MKSYKLKQWYPDIPSYMDNGFIIDYYEENGKAIYTYPFGISVEFNLPAHHLECPDFWEEVKQPLFITDDNIKIFDDTTEIISVSIKHHTVSKWGYRYLCKPLDCENFKHFGIEANADKYIEENKPKPLFITEDGVEYYKLDFAIGFNIHNQSTIKHNDWREEDLNNFKIFAHKSNADEYIAWHKKGFSVNDLLLADIGITTNQLDKLHQMAIKKI